MFGALGVRTQPENISGSALRGCRSCVPPRVSPGLLWGGDSGDGDLGRPWSCTDPCFTSSVGRELGRGRQGWQLPGEGSEGSTPRLEERRAPEPSSAWRPAASHQPVRSRSS